MTSIRPRRTGLFAAAITYGAGAAVSQAAAFFLLPIYTRFLSPADYGLQDVLGLTAGLVAIVLGGGLSLSLSRFYYRDEYVAVRREVISTALCIAGASGLLGALLLTPLATVLSSLALGQRSQAPLIVLTLWTLALGLVVDVWLTFLRVTENPRAYVAASLSQLALNIGLNLWFIVGLHLGVRGIFLAALFSRFAAAAFLTVLYGPKTGLQFNRAVAFALLRFSLPLVPSRLCSVLVSSSDRYFLAHLASLTDVGIYGVAARLVSPLSVLIGIPFFNAYDPQRFQMAAVRDGPQRMARIFDHYMTMLFVAATGISLFARELLTLMTSSDFHAAAGLVPLCAANLLLYLARMHFDFGILQSGDTRLAAYATIITAVVQLTANAVLIPHWGVVGALVAQMVGNVLAGALLLRFSQPRFRIPFSVSHTLRLLVASGTAVLLLSQVRTDSLPTAFALKSLGFILYLCALVAVRVLHLSDLSSVVRRVRGTART